MTQPRTLFDAWGFTGGDNVILNVGAPGPKMLRKAAELMKKATQARLEEELAGDAPLLQYGSPQGDPLYISQLSQFLTAEYGDPVDRSSLVTTAGATNGLYLLLTMLFPERCPIFVEEVSYFLALRVFSELKFPIFPVIMDDDGMDMDDLIRQIEVAKSKYPNSSPEHGHWAALYTIPIFHNPTGRCLSPARSKRLIEIAHEHGIVVISEDVYNLLYYEGIGPPKRLFAYDRERMSLQGDTSDGCVISNCSFSKLLTPGLRLGWLELPVWMQRFWNSKTVMWSGGSLNMYTSGLIGKAIELGLVKEYIQTLRNEYKKRRDVMLEKLKQGVPESCRVFSPKGGYFIWVELPKDVEANSVQTVAMERYKILMMDGAKSCLPDVAMKYKNCIRLAVSYYEAGILSEYTEQLASVISDCVQKRS